MGQAFKDGFVAKSIVQALNRIRCRKSVDAFGNCMPTKLFMLQGNNRTSSAVMSAIQSQMPGIQIQGWEVKTANRQPRRIPGHEKLLGHFATSEAGMQTKAAIMARLGINERTFQRMSPTMQEFSSPLAQRLTSLGVRYYCSIGRGKEAYFVKS